MFEHVCSAGGIGALDWLFHGGGAAERAWAGIALAMVGYGATRL